MVTVYIEQSIKEQKHNKLATLNHNQQENSNLIMPFLVQNDKMIKRPNYTNKGILLKKKKLFFLTLLPISLKYIKLYVCDHKTQNQKAELLLTDVSECA